MVKIKMRLPSLFLIIISMFSLISCDKNVVFDEFKSVENQNWNYNNPINFQFEITDTISKYNLYINLRNNNEYSFKHLNLVTAFYLANRKEKIIDSLQYSMIDENGFFLGEGFSSIKENKLCFKSDFNFPNKGVYNLEISHHMVMEATNKRIKDLSGILDVGLRVEKVKDYD